MKTTLEQRHKMYWRDHGDLSFEEYKKFDTVRLFFLWMTYLSVSLLAAFYGGLAIRGFLLMYGIL